MNAIGFVESLKNVKEIAFASIGEIGLNATANKIVQVK